MKAPILCVDFDGVLHSYESGWKGASVIPDGPVPGAIEWLISILTMCEHECAMAPRHKNFDVCIFSARNKQWGGIRAMKKWLSAEFVKAGRHPQLIEMLRFPLFKPAAFLTIDDRVHCFTGVFPSEKEMLAFKPWNKKGV